MDTKAASARHSEGEKQGAAIAFFVYWRSRNHAVENTIFHEIWVIWVGGGGGTPRDVKWRSGGRPGAQSGPTGGKRGRKLATGLKEAALLGASFGQVAVLGAPFFRVFLGHLPRRHFLRFWCPIGSKMEPLGSHFRIPQQFLRRSGTSTKPAQA